jgi:predicted RNA-binding Zn-ribbon protein involved in translation (DUF1610 family)
MYAAKAISVKCPKCGHEIARIFKNAVFLGIPKQICKKCGSEVYIENYVPWQSMTEKRKALEIFSLIFRSLILGSAFGGAAGAVILFLLILVFPGDLSEFPLTLCYAFTTAPPVLFLVIRPWYGFFKIYKLGKKYIAEDPAS